MDLRSGATELLNPHLGSLIGHCNEMDGIVDLMTSAGVGEDDLLTYPKGQSDAVTITARDLEGLQPGKFLSDNIIDFYVKYLSLEILSRDSEKQQQVHFFSSFFFTKFLESTEFGGKFLRVADYEQLQRWIGDVNLFEKDYIFIPVVQRSHWSLIVICHLGRLVQNALGDKEGSACILHLDPLEGNHERLEVEVKGFLYQEGMKIVNAGGNMDILGALAEMKYVQAKVPQQSNGYDCGVYVLHYIEVFLSKWTSSDSSISSCQAGDQFTNPNFVMEVLYKRSWIQSLILELSGTMEGRGSNPSDVEEKPEKDVGLVQQSGPQRHCLRRRAKETKSNKFTQEETSVLLQCMLDSVRFGIKGKQGSMRWDLISQEINERNGGLLRSDDQCRRRFDTLLKAYRKLESYCKRNGKTFVEITDAEKQEMNLATPLKKENAAWFNDLHTICCQRPSLREKATKRRRSNLDGGIDINKSEASRFDSEVGRPMPSGAIGSLRPKVGSLFPKEGSWKRLATRFRAMEEEWKCTLLNLIQACSMKSWLSDSCLIGRGRIEGVCSMEEICKMLAIVQDQNPWEIRKHVYVLRNRKFVAVEDVHEDNDGVDEWKINQVVRLTGLKLFKEFGEKVLSKNPQLRTFWRIRYGDVLATTLFPLQQIRVLSMCNCREFIHVDLGNFPELRCLHISSCENLKSIGGWGVVKELGWIEISDCKSYSNLPDMGSLSSLRKFAFDYIDSGLSMGWQSAYFGKCTRLWRLDIRHDMGLVESMELGALKFLETLSFTGCQNLSTIHGLKGLLSLTKLHLYECSSLKRVPELGCLKALTYLDMSCSGLVEIPGVEALPLLTTLLLTFCYSLESLPFLV